MKLVTIEIQGKARPGVLVDAEVLDLSRCEGTVPGAGPAPPSLRALLEEAGGLDRVRRILERVGERAETREHLRQAGGFIPYAEARLLPPVPDPALILSCGVNYRAHLREMNTPVPERPLSFAKSVASLIGSGAPIVLPKSHPDMVDWEGEFSAVIGRPCHQVSAADALSYVAGYTLVNDVSARDFVAPVFSSAGLWGPIQAWELNLLGKMFPTFCPMGPAIVTRDELPDPGDVHLTTRLNGAVMQSAHTSDLVFGVAELIAHYSQFYRFRPGDVITTGSPAGVGYGRTPKLFMKPGDVIEVHADAIGTLANAVVAAG